MRFTDRSSQTNRPSIELSPLKVRRRSISAHQHFPKYSLAHNVKTKMYVAVILLFFCAALLTTDPPSFLLPRSLLTAQFASHEAPMAIVFDVGQQLEVAC